MFTTQEVCLLVGELPSIAGWTGEIPVYSGRRTREKNLPLGYMVVTITMVQPRKYRLPLVAGKVHNPEVVQRLIVPTSAQLQSGFLENTDEVDTTVIFRGDYAVFRK